MIKGIYHAAAGMLPRANQQEAVANNLANVNTTGFKRDRRFFRRVLNNSLIQGGKYGEPGMMSESEESMRTDYSQGSLVETRNPLDLSIMDDGFFVLETGETTSYTRNGNFSISTDGELINSREYKVMGEDGPIRISGQNVVIHEDGEVLVDGESAGKIKIVSFEKKDNLARNGFGYFVPEMPDEEITPETVNVKQGFLENSNVEPILEMVQMIELNRNYESCQKSIIAQDETLRLAVNKIAG